MHLTIKDIKNPNSCLLPGSFETGPDGRAFSEGKEQFRGESGGDSRDTGTALEQEVENTHLFWDVFRREVKYSWF